MKQLTLSKQFSRYQIADEKHRYYWLIRLCRRLGWVPKHALEGRQLGARSRRQMIAQAESVIHAQVVGDERFTPNPALWRPENPRSTLRGFVFRDIR